MKITLINLTLACIAATFLSGCGNSESGLGKLFSKSSNDAGPDEFAIVPTKPLELPEDMVSLPEPDVGGPNLVDPKPEHDAVAAMGGRPDRLDSNKINGGEGALLAAATRFGTSANIRGVLAAEDEKFREKNGPKLLERWLGTDTYLSRYEAQTLEARRELGRMRRIGARTPTAPPPDDE